MTSRRQAPDLVVHAGDLALNGPRPAEVVDRIREVRFRRVRYDLEAQIAELRASRYPSRSWLIKVHQRAESIRPLELDAPSAADHHDEAGPMTAQTAPQTPERR